MTPGPPITVAEIEAHIAECRRQADECWARDRKVEGAKLHEEARAFGAILCGKGVHTTGARCARCDKVLR